MICICCGGREGVRDNRVKLDVLRVSDLSHKDREIHMELRSQVAGSGRPYRNAPKRSAGRRLLIIQGIAFERKGFVAEQITDRAKETEEPKKRAIGKATGLT